MNQYRVRVLLKLTARDYDVQAEMIGTAINRALAKLHRRETFVSVTASRTHSIVSERWPNPVRAVGLPQEEPCPKKPAPASPAS